MKNESEQIGKISGKALLIIVLLIATVGVLTFVFVGRKSGTETTNPQTARGAADTFINAAAKKNAEASYALFTDEFKQKLGAEGWQAQLDFLFADNTLSTPAFTNSQDVPDSNPESKILTYTLTRTGAGKTITYDISLTTVKVGDSWRISKIDDQERT